MKPNQKMTVDQIIKVLRQFIVDYDKVPTTEKQRQSEIVWYWTGLNRLGFTESMYDHHTRVKPNQDIIYLMKIIRSIQERKLVEGAIRKDSNINPTVALRILACKHGWIEEKDNRKLQLDEKKLENEKTQHSDLMESINIVFDGEDDED